jgi:hypothetical protein
MVVTSVVRRMLEVAVRLQGKFFVAFSIPFNKATPSTNY